MNWVNVTEKNLELRGDPVPKLKNQIQACHWESSFGLEDFRSLSTTDHGHRTQKGSSNSLTKWSQNLEFKSSFFTGYASQKFYFYSFLWWMREEGRERLIRIYKMLYLHTYVRRERENTHHHMPLLTRLKCTMHTRRLPRFHLLIFIVMNIPNNKCWLLVGPYEALKILMLSLYKTWQFYIGQSSSPPT